MKKLRWPFGVLIALITVATGSMRSPGTVLAQSAPAESTDPLWQRCYETVQWHISVDVPSTEGQLKDLVTDQQLVPHSERWIRSAIASAPSLDECLAEARRQHKLLLWYVPAVEGQHLILPHFLDRYVMTGPFADPELADLVNRRYLPIRLPAGGALAERFELRSPEFMQPGLLVFDRSGNQVFRMNRIATFNADYFAAVLRQLARQHGAGHGPRYQAALDDWNEDRDDPERGLRMATESLAAGELEQARGALTRAAETAPPELVGSIAYLRGVVARQQRKATPALKHLRRALTAWKVDPVKSADPPGDASPEDATSDNPPPAGVSGPGPGDALVEWGRVLIHQGKESEAIATLERAIAQHPAARRAPEGGYFLGAARYFTADESGADAAWKKVCTSYPESPWAARAHANLAQGTDRMPGEAALTRSMEDPRWLPAEVYRIAPDTQWRRSPRSASDIARRAVEFLLRQQRSDGSWYGLRWGKGANDAHEFRNFTTAITAVSCLALTRWEKKSPRRISDAVTRGEAYLLEENLVRRGDVLVWVYADAFRLLHFADRLPELGGTEQEQVRARMETWVANLVSHQRQNEGAFKHYTYSSTFVTATVAYCLHHARQRGIAVPEATFDAIVRVLESARGPEGLFGYLVSHPNVTRTPKGAANRQPLCEWALLLAGRSTPERIAQALESFFSTYHASAELARKSNFHVPELDSTAGYYFFHNFYPACRAVSHSGPGARKHRKLLLQLLCELPEIDGSFIDSGFSYGKSYSTAMALLSLHALKHPAR